MSELFNIHMALDLSEWTSTVVDSGDLSWSESAGLGGTSGGMAVLLDDTNDIYAQKNFNKSSITRQRFYIDPNTLAITAWTAFDAYMFQQQISQVNIARIRLNRTLDSYRLSSIIYDDAGAEVVSVLTLITDIPHYVEIKIVSATTNSSADGSAEVWIDDSSIGAASNVDNYNRMQDQNWRIVAGAMSVGEQSGTFYLDEFVANDDGGAIGPVSNAIAFTANNLNLNSPVFGNPSMFTFAEYQYFRPTINSSIGNWTDQDGGVNVAEAMSEVVPSDAEYGQSELSPSDSPCVVKLNINPDPETWLGRLAYRFWKEPADTTETINYTMQLRQDYVSEAEQGTLIAQWVQNNVSTTKTTLDQLLTVVQFESITDFGSLFIRMVASNS